jgi:hypothetical protein
MTVVVAVSSGTVPGWYELMVSATDGLVTQGVYVGLVVLQ